MTKKIVIGLVLVSAFAAVVSSGFVWHQPSTPNCIA